MRADRDEGLPADPPPRRGVDAGAAVRVHGLREARAADRHPLRPRGARANRRRWGDRRADRRGGRACRRRGARRRRGRGADRLPAQRACQRAPRARRRGHRRLRRARPAGVDLVGDPARVPRVRAHRDDADERVRRAGPREVPDERPRRSCSRARAGADPGRAVGRRPDEPRVGPQEPGADGAVGAGRRRQRGIVRRVPRGLRPHPHVRHGWDVDGRRRLRVGPPRDHARDERRRLSRARARGRRREHRRRRRLDRVRRGRRPEHFESARRAPARFPARRATAAAARRRRSRTPTSSSATCRRVCSAASSSSTPTRRTRRSRRSPRLAVRASRRPHARS